MVNKKSLLIIIWRAIVMLMSVLMLTESNLANTLRIGEPHPPRALAMGPAWSKVSLRKGDTLSSIFKKMGISQQDAWKLGRLYRPLQQLYPHQLLYIQSTSHRLLALQYPLSSHTAWLITRQAGHTFSRQFIHTPPTPMHLYCQSLVITRDMYQAAKRSGISAQLLLQLEHMFAGSIDFLRHLHIGDRFDFIYQAPHNTRASSGQSKILAAIFTHKHHRYRAIRYTDPLTQQDGYYTGKGHQSSQQTFLSAPLHYRRISSYFNLHRLHPILHQIKPHHGVDFAAPRGTPVRSIGDGYVTFVGQQRGFGNTIVIHYHKIYAGLYAHLSRFIPHIQPGQMVKKGQLIGYVGATGWATGPHLHFSFYVHGKPRDWLMWSRTHIHHPSRLSHESILAREKYLLDKLQAYQQRIHVTHHTAAPH